MVCNYCGGEIEPNSAFCKFCGGATEAKQVSPINEVNQQNMSPAKPANIFAILGLVFAFVFPVLGIVFSSLGMRDAKTLGNNESYGMAIAGLVLSIVFTALAFIVIIAVLANPEYYTSYY